MKFIFLALTLTFVGCSERNLSGDLPKSWVLLPEDFHSAKEDEVNYEYEEPANEAGSQVQKILDTTGAAVSSVAHKETSWNLIGFNHEIAVTRTGFMGLAVSQGTSGVRVHWTRKEEQAQESIPLDSGNESVAEEKQIEVIANTGLRTGRIKDPQAFRMSLTNQVQNLVNMAKQLSFDPGTQWWVSSIRFDLSVDASGIVTPGIVAGGVFRTGIEFKRKQPKQVRQKPTAFNSMMVALAEEVDGVYGERLDNSGFSFSSIRFCIGLSGSAQVGLAKVASAAIGTVTLSRGHVQRVFERKSASEIDIVEDPTLEPVHLPREKFRKGLSRALKMGLWVSKHAERFQFDKWKINQMDILFRLSNTGLLGLSTITGFSSMELSFTK